MLGVTLPPQISTELEAALQQEKVYIAKRGNRIRLAPHVYNDTAEVDRLFEVLPHYLKQGHPAEPQRLKMSFGDLVTIFCFNRPVKISSWSAHPDDYPTPNLS